MDAKHARTGPGRLLVALLSAGLAGTVLAGCGIGTKTSTSRYRIAARVTDLSVRTTGGDINVFASTGDGVRVTEKLRYSGPRPHTEHAVRDGGLFLSAPGCEHRSSGQCGITYTVEVPRGTAVSLHSDGGDLDVRGLSGTTQASTDGGRVRVSGSAARKAVLRTSGGQVEAAFTAVPDQVDASSRGGDVTVRVPAGPYALDVTTGGGHRAVSVTDDPASAHRVSAHTDGGNVSVSAR